MRWLLTITKWHFLGVIALIGAASLSYVLYADAGLKTSPIVLTETRLAGEAMTAGQQMPRIVLSDTQLSGIKVALVRERTFHEDREEIGTISFNEDLTVQVFPPYAGRIASVFGEMGDDIKKGTVLYTIDSPDLLQAESTLIAAAGVAQLTTKNLSRVKELLKTHAAAEKDVEQAASDQQTAEGALHTARNALHLFGKTNEEIDQIVERRLADSILVVRSPISGRITQRNASLGIFVQPGIAPAPYTVANIDTMWMIANVPETDSPAFRNGQHVRVLVDAFPDRSFDGTIAMIGSMVDSSTRRVLVRSDVQNPNKELRSGMFAKFVIWTGQPMTSAAVPLSAVIREGDGSMTVWTTAKRNTFVRRTVKTGMSQDGYWQVLEGLKPNEHVVTQGAIFLSNAVAAN